MEKIYEVKTIEDAQKQAVQDFGLSEEDLSFEVVKESKGFLGLGSKIEVKVTVTTDGIEAGRNYIKMILDNNGAEGFVEKKVRGNNVEFNVDAGDFNGYLIGKNSRNLIALQTLVSTIVNRYYDEEEKKVVLVDVGGYKKRREKNLEYMAVDWGKQVAKTRTAITITDLNAYERKIVHNKLSTWKDVTTHSEGEGQDRVLIIEPK